MTSSTLLKENLTRETFLVELSRARAKGAQLATNLFFGNFHAVPNGTEFSQYIPKFSKIIIGKFFFRIQICSRMSKFLVERFAFRKRFRKSGNFSGKILYQLPLFPKFLKFWVNGKRPKCIQEILVLRESSARTTMCKKVCCTSILDLLTLALLITSPG